MNPSRDDADELNPWCARAPKEALNLLKVLVFFD